MRGLRVLSTVAIAGVLACGACSPAHRRDAAAAASSEPPRSLSAASPRPAPADPDLGAVLERYYQDIEGAHWSFAYAMLSPRVRATMSTNDLMDRYELFASPQITVRPTRGTSLDVWLDGNARDDPRRALHLVEHVTMVWDGEQWVIDALAPRSFTPSGTR